MKYYLFMITIVALSACSPYPKKVDELATHLSFTRHVVLGEGFRHVVYSNNKWSAENKVHIYLEGDGTPWVKKYFPATDPTSRKPLVLKLMAKDPIPSLYVGRPCYHGFYIDKECNGSWWTSHRYSHEVVNSMLSAIKAKLTKNSDITLIGHSGGGALAMLIASRLEGVSAVVTIAGNLDTQAWTKEHGYSPLSGSLNPAKQAPLPKHIKQWHYIGEDDKNTTPAMIKAALAKEYNKEIISYKGYGHTCCWERVWTDIVNSL